MWIISVFYFRPDYLSFRSANQRIARHAAANQNEGSQSDDGIVAALRGNVLRTTEARAWTVRIWW